MSYHYRMTVASRNRHIYISSPPRKSCEENGCDDKCKCFGGTNECKCPESFEKKELVMDE